MKKNYLLLIPVLAFSFSGCSKLFDLAENQIIDPQGVEITLTWSNNEPRPLDGANLDLYIRDESGVILARGAANSIGVETITIKPNNFNEGRYEISVFVSRLNSPTNYRITARGISTAKEYSLDFTDVTKDHYFKWLSPADIDIFTDRYIVYK